MLLIAAAVAHDAAAASSGASAACRLQAGSDAGLEPPFYAGSASECAAQSQAATGWLFQLSETFQIELPDLATGTCPNGTVDVSHLFTNRADSMHTIDTLGPARMMPAGYVQSSATILCVATPTASSPTPTINPTLQPAASIIVTLIAPDTFSLSSIVSTTPGVAVVSYAWNLGDGTAASGATASHRYTASGTYPVVLTITDSTGATANAVKSVVAAVVPPPRPPSHPATAGAPGSWTKYATSSPAGTEAEYQSWYNLVYDTKRNLVYGMNWMGVLAAFNPVAGTWSNLTPSIGGGVHNRTFAYDPINDRVWIGTGTGSQLLGVNYFDLTSRQFVSYPMTGALPGTNRQ